MGKKKAIVTNAMRMLKSGGFKYEAIEYETDGTVSEHFGEEISRKTGIPPEQSFKTLVARGEKCGIIVVCIPVNTEVNLKKLASAANDKKVELIHVKELLGLTGYIRGGVSPIGMKKFFKTTVHYTAADYDTIFFSGGRIGFQIELDIEDIGRVIEYKLEDITKEDRV